MHGGMVLSREARGSAEALPSREVRSRAVGYVTVHLAPYLGLKLVYRGTWSTGYRQQCNHNQSVPLRILFGYPM
jgi:hypothetical protein